MIALGIAASATATGSVTLDAPPAASTALLVQVTVWPLTVQLQSPYLPAAGVMPAGISSTNVIAPVVATVPLGLQNAGATIALTPGIGADGRTLTLRPQAEAGQTAQAIDEAADTLARKQ